MIRRLPAYGVYALLAYMPFHIFVSQWLGTSLGGLEGWKIGKDLVTIGLLAMTGVLVLLKVQRREWQNYIVLLVLAALYAALHVVLYLVNKDTPLDTAALASTYNNRFIWIFLIAVGGGLLLKYRADHRQLVKFVLVISTIVCVLGLLQWFLPKDILKHFGYSQALGVKPNFFINEDPALPRIFATFRDPNSFGAYLIIPILLLVQLIQKQKNKVLLCGLLVLHLIVLYLSFSRGAWLGLAVGLGMVLVMSHRQKTVHILKWYWPVLAVGLLVLYFAAYSVRGTQSFRSIVLKADDKNAAAALDSDEYHLRFIKEGVQGVVDKPLGHGPGTAGIVSIRNRGNQQLTENYYVQIAYEVGVVGLAVFVAIWLFVIRRLVTQVLSPLTITLLGAAAAYAVMCLVMHLWTNEAVAFGWWGLAGLAVGSGKKRSKPAQPGGIGR
ncbi:MAG TPA: O-antigen ligase family protein [Candidatus Limnocylindria bacterium]|nr:O-antigen ligase family protein [Candidatus Limnocylindria bacterium]